MAAVEDTNLTMAAPETAVAPPAEPSAVVPTEEVPATTEAPAVVVSEPAQQPTLTHAQQGNLHSESEPATQLDGTPANKEEPPKDESKVEAATEDSKAAVKEKVEKTKTEGKGFFAKLFGSKDKSPKKEKKVKTPKTEKADPLKEAAPEGPVEPTAPSVTAEKNEELEKAKETKEVTGAGIAAAHTDGEASTSAAAVEPKVEKPVKETETTSAAPVTTEAAAVAPAATEDKPAETGAGALEKNEPPTKQVKANRRISTRFIQGFKNFGKKEPSSATDEKPKSTEGETSTEAPAAVNDEAPKLEKPVLAEPLKMDEPSTSIQTPAAAPPAAPVVAATA